MYLSGSKISYVFVTLFFGSLRRIRKIVFHTQNYFLFPLVLRLIIICTFQVGRFDDSRSSGFPMCTYLKHNWFNHLFIATVISCKVEICTWCLVGHVPVQPDKPGPNLLWRSVQRIIISSGELSTYCVHYTSLFLRTKFLIRINFDYNCLAIPGVNYIL